MHLLEKYQRVSMCVFICLDIIIDVVCRGSLPLLGLWLLLCVPFRLACVYLYNSESDYWVLLIITTNTTWITLKNVKLSKKT